MDETSLLLESIMGAYQDDACSRRTYSLMGPNACGKSRLLEKFKAHLVEKGIRNLLIPAERRIDPGEGVPIFGSTLEDIISIIMHGLSPDPTATFAGAPPHWRPRPLEINKAVRTLITEAHKINVKALIDSQRKKRTSDVVTTDINPMLILIDKLKDVLSYEMFTDNGSTVRFSKGEIEFDLDKLSSGEKQILLVSIFLVVSRTDKIVLLIDEPELHLNDALAANLWEKVEVAFPKCVFVYATHSPFFATRSGMTPYLIKRVDSPPEPIDLTKPLSRIALQELIGAKIQVLREDGYPVFYEDELLGLIVKDVLADLRFGDGKKLSIIPVTLHGYEAVINAVKGDTQWDTLRSEGPARCGVIDRDARTDSDVAELATMGVFCFPRYEAESLLIDPKLALWFLKGSCGEMAEAEYTDVLVESAKCCLKPTLDRVAKRLADRNQQVIKYFKTEDGCYDVKIDPTPNLREMAIERYNLLNEAIKNRSADDIITLFKGKKLYNIIYGKIASRKKYPFADAIERYKTVTRMKGFQDLLLSIQWISTLRLEIQKHMTVRSSILGVTVASCLAFAAAQANAGDFYPGGYRDGPVYAPAVSWAGVYAGINGGYGSSNGNQLADPYNSFFGGISPSGGFAGGQIGYNWQRGPFVFGVETDLQGSGISDSGTDVFGGYYKSDLDYFGTLRGRLGYGVDKTLFYVSGGFAYGGLTKHTTDSGYNFLYSGTATGYVVGAGLEYKLSPDWSVKAEYQYLNFGNNDPMDPIVGSFGAGTGNYKDDDYNTFRVGLNYYLGGSGYQPLK